MAIVEVRRLSAEHTSGIRSRIIGLYVPRGRARYVQGMWPTEQPSTRAKSAVTSGDVLIGIRVDLWKLIFKPMDDA